jgi:hypothetical protein
MAQPLATPAEAIIADSDLVGQDPEADEIGSMVGGKNLTLDRVNPQV